MEECQFFNLAADILMVVIELGKEILRNELWVFDFLKKAYYDEAWKIRHGGGEIIRASQDLAGNSALCKIMYGIYRSLNNIPFGKQNNDPDPELALLLLAHAIRDFLFIFITCSSNSVFFYIVRHIFARCFVNF